MKYNSIRNISELKVSKIIVLRKVFCACSLVKEYSLINIHYLDD